jgi:signal transduction histidine kinase
MSWSLRRRLAVTVVATSTVVFLVMAAALYVGVRHAAFDQHDQALLSRARAVAASAESEGDDYEMVLPRQAANEPAAYIEVWRPDGSTLVRSDSLGSADLPRAFAPSAGYALRDVTLPDGRAGRAIALPFFARNESDPHGASLVLVLAEGTEPADAAVSSVRTIFLAVGVLSIALIAAMTLLVLARGTRRLGRLASQIEQIDDRQLSMRLASDGQPRELEVTVNKLNELLARLEGSFTRERALTADVSHELRTPLAALRTLLEVTALENRSPDDYRTAVADALRVVSHMTALVENLLVLARLDAGTVPIVESDTDLHGLVEECWREHRALASQRGLVFSNKVAPGTTIRTDREKLRVVVRNLLANAAEYTERDGWVTVSNDRVVLAVCDSGPPIPEAQLERMFDRFWRGDQSRTGDGAHSGIGLSLSRELCTRLAMSLDASSSSDGGVTFRIATQPPAG